MSTASIVEVSDCTGLRHLLPRSCGTAPPPFFEGTRAKFNVTLENCWYWRVLLLLRIRVKTDEKDRNGRSVLMDCDCAMIDCLYDYAPGVRLLLVTCSRQ